MFDAAAESGNEEKHVVSKHPIDSASASACSMWKMSGPTRVPDGTAEPISGDRMSIPGANGHRETLFSLFSELTTTSRIDGNHPG